MTAQDAPSSQAGEVEAAASNGAAHDAELSGASLETNGADDKGAPVRSRKAKPVSYTQLDVYKRQKQGQGRIDQDQHQIGQHGQRHVCLSLRTQLLRQIGHEKDDDYRQELQDNPKNLHHAQRLSEP